jgi:hypothetical protein
MAAQHAEEQTPFAYQITETTIHTEMTLTVTAVNSSAKYFVARKNGVKATHCCMSMLRHVRAAIVAVGKQ